jgi:hypothetical protein
VKLDTESSHLYFSVRSTLKVSVPGPNPDPDPQDPHVFGHPGSGSTSQR